MTLDISWGRFKITRNFLHRTEYSTGLWMVSFLCYFKLIKCQHLPLILFQDMQAIGNLNPNTVRELTAFEHQSQVSSDTTSILTYNSSIGTVGQPPVPQASGQYWTTSPSTNHNSLNLHTLLSEAQVQCSSPVKSCSGLVGPSPLPSPESARICSHHEEADFDHDELGVYMSQIRFLRAVCLLYEFA